MHTRRGPLSALSTMSTHRPALADSKIAEKLRSLTSVRYTEDGNPLENDDALDDSDRGRDEDLEEDQDRDHQDRDHQDRDHQDRDHQDRGAYRRVSRESAERSDSDDEGNDLWGTARSSRSARR